MNGSMKLQVRASRSTRRTASIAKPATSRTPPATLPGFLARGVEARTTRRCRHDCVRRPHPSGHDTAILPAFAGKAGQIGGGRPILPLDSLAFFLRFNAKSGIVEGLDAP